MVICKISYSVPRNKTKNSPFKFLEPIKDFSFSPNFIKFAVLFSVKTLLTIQQICETR